MESEVLGKKSPLHGRRTAQIRVRPFDYLTSARMVPTVSAEDAFRYYACVGGVPYYLAQIDESRPFLDNIADLFFRLTDCSMKSLLCCCDRSCANRLCTTRFFAP